MFGAEVTRLGLLGTARQVFGSFANKVAAGVGVASWVHPITVRPLMITRPGPTARTDIIEFGHVE